MDLNIQYLLKNSPNHLRYLRENSFWYKYLNRNPMYFKDFDNDMKIKYKLTTKDRIDKFSKNMDKISQIIDIFS